MPVDARSIIFDGKAGPAARINPFHPEVEIIYSRAGQSADQLIERAAHRLSAFGRSWW